LKLGSCSSVENGNHTATQTRKNKRNMYKIPHQNIAYYMPAMYKKNPAQIRFN